MKTARLLLWLLLFSLLLGGCAPSPGSADPAAREVLDTLLSAAPETEDSCTVYDSAAEDSPVMLEMFYAMSREDVADFSFALGNGANAFEIAVFRLTDNSDPQQAADCCQTRLQNRMGDFFGYAPEQAELVANGRILSAGQWVALVISRDPAAVERAFSACFRGQAVFSDKADADLLRELPDGRIRYVDPDIDDMTLYDTSAILAAWNSGNTASLSKKDAAILRAAEAVLKETVTDGMTDKEKELAVYTWLTANLDYDWDHQTDPKRMDKDSYNPYGALVNHKAVCLGFATAFQLLMDMSGVECITVVGAAFQSREDHAWNMVRLDGKWYCADPTWDMGVPPAFFRFFNVTSDYMAESDHQWDYFSVPETD